MVRMLTSYSMPERRHRMTGSADALELRGGWRLVVVFAGLAEGTACGAGAHDPRCGCCRGVG